MRARVPLAAEGCRRRDWDVVEYIRRRCAVGMFRSPVPGEADAEPAAVESERGGATSPCHEGSDRLLSYSVLFGSLCARGLLA